MLPLETRLLIRILAIGAAVLTLVSITFYNLLYIPGLLIGLADVLIYRRAKPEGIKPYLYIALISAVVAFIMFIVQGILGFVFFVNS